MDPINSLSKIMETLRRQASSGSDRLNQKQAQTKENNEVSRASKPNLKQLEQQIATRIIKLDQDDPNKFKKATKIFVESVLAWEFGTELLQDSRFSEIIKKVETTIEQEPKLKKELGELINQFQ